MDNDSNFIFLWPVHGFQHPSYTVNEGESSNITFQRDVKGTTRFPLLQLIGAVMSRGDPAGRLLAILTHTHTHIHSHKESAETKFFSLDYRPVSGMVAEDSLLTLQLQVYSDAIAVELRDKITLEFTPSDSVPYLIELVEATGEFINHRAEAVILDQNSELSHHMHFVFCYFNNSLSIF